MLEDIDEAERQPSLYALTSEAKNRLIAHARQDASHAVACLEAVLKRQIEMRLAIRNTNVLLFVLTVLVLTKSFW